MADSDNTNIRRPKHITNTDYILQITEKTLGQFLYKIKKGPENIIYLDKYLIKIICLLIIYGYNKTTILMLSPILNDLKKLLFTLNEFTLPNDSVEVLTNYLNNIFNYQVNQMLKDKNNNNDSNNFIRIDKTNTHEENIKFIYKVIDYSEYQKKSLQFINKEKLRNEEIFRPSKLYIYFTERKNNFHILAGNNATNLDIMDELIYNSFVDDCMFDMTNFRGFSRYVSKKHTNEPPTENNTRGPRLRFKNDVKK